MLNTENFKNKDPSTQQSTQINYLILINLLNMYCIFQPYGHPHVNLPLTLHLQDLLQLASLS
jgi:uncharacterized Zn-finger protein